MRATRILVLGIGLLCAISAPSGVIAQQGKVATTQEISTVVTLRDVRVDRTMVTGTIVNLSHRALRDVRLLIRHAWLWRDERNPGHDNPGRTEAHIVPEEIPAGGTYRLAYTISPPLPDRNDGRFVTTVEIVGFTEVGF
jgi:hypothetical protein